MKFPDWQSEQGHNCLLEIESKYFEERTNLFGAVFLFQTMYRSEEYFKILQALTIPIEELPLLMSSGHQMVDMVIETRMKYNI